MDTTGLRDPENTRRPGSSPRLLPVPAAARALSVSTSTAWRMIRRGTLPHVRLGTRVMVSTASLDRFIAERLQLEWKPLVPRGQRSRSDGQHAS